MAKLKSTLPNMLLSLTGICLIAGAILAGVNAFTAGPIAVAKAAALEEAIKAVAPEFDNKPTEEAYMAVTADGDSLKIYPAKKGDETVSFFQKPLTGRIFYAILIYVLMIWRCTQVVEGSGFEIR